MPYLYYIVATIHTKYQILNFLYIITIKFNNSTEVKTIINIRLIEEGERASLGVVVNI